MEPAEKESIENGENLIEEEYVVEEACLLG